MTAQRTVEDIYPLSPIQQGMLFHTLYAPDSGMYISQTSFQVAGGFDPASFKRALARVIERHAVLRSSFAWKGLDQPVQVVHRDTSLPVREEDWSGLPEIERGQRLEDYLSRDAVQGFDLDQPPLMRFLLAREAECTFRLVWSLHLLLADGWSTARIIGELFACHEAFRQGLEPRFEPPRRYRDYIAWLARQDSRQAETFWRRELAGFHEPTPLPGDRGPGRTASITEHRALLSEGTTEALQGFARANQLTVNTLVQGAWSLLLSRLSGQREVVFGVTISGRPPELPGVEAMVGPFINTLPLRAEVAPEAPLGEWLRQLQDRHSEARQFGHVPLVELQTWSELPRGVPLFESLLVFENYPVDTAARQESDGLIIEDFRTREVVNYALTLVGVPGRRLALSLSWDRARFDADAIERLSGYLIRLLEDMVRSPATRLESLEHLPSWERHQLLVEWNDGGAMETGPPLHGLFEAQARRRPDAVAITGERESLTYGELNRRANRLAHHLIALGVRREVLTALCLERSAELVVAILAVLKAGGAYVPLDPAYPPERLRFLLEDCGASLLIAQRQVAESLPPSGERRLFLDDDQPWAGTPETDPELAIDPRNLAYVIYTSGSTGRPKGALVPHAHVSRLFRSTETWFGFGERDVWSLFHSYAFDFSVWEIWGALLHGGRLVVVPWWVSRSPESFHELLVREGVTVLNQTPAAFRQLIRADEAAGVETALRLVIFGGDVLELESLSPWLARHGDERPRLVNMYGITETTVHVTYRPLSAADAERGGASPIGIPIPDLRVYLLDSALRPVPIGVAGEMYVGGAGVARGYLNRPDLTAQRFVPDLFAEIPGERLYRAGDLARRRADGGLEYLGRIDDQVKIRGFRIEPGEIEAMLSRHPGIRECAVLARRGLSGENRLVAYLVPRGEDAPTLPELRVFLRERLPDPMVPSAFVALPSLPLTSHGKLDRRALPDPEPAAGTGDDGTPLRPIEEVLAGIWAEMLGREHVGRQESFFDLGGHSLLATRAVSAVRRAFRIDLPLRALFDHPTVAELAGVVAATLRSGSGLATPPIERTPRRQDDHGSPLSFAQQRLWFLSRLNPESDAYNVPAAVLLNGPLDVAALAACLGEIVRRHETLRTTFREVRDEPVQVIAPAAPVPLPVTDLRALPAERREGEARQLALDATRRPFDLTHGPLLRIALLQLGDEEHLAIFAVHHIVSDGWSMSILVREVAALYAAFVRGEGSPLPEPSVQYADFAYWQRQWLQGEALERSLAFWNRRLAGAPPLFELPGARPRPPQPTGRGAERSRLLPLELALRLQALCRRESATLFMTLLAAFQVVLHARTGATDLVVGTDVAGRDHAETEGLIGFFINQLALRGDLSGNPTFQELLGRVRDTLLEAYTHQDLPFDRLVEALGAGRDLRHAPVFQVKLVLQNAPRAELSMPGLTLGTFDLGSTTAQIDLNLRATETAAGLFLSLAFSTEIYDAGTMDRLLEQLEILLRSVVERPATRLRELVAEIGEAGRSLQAERDRELREASREKLLALRRRPASGADA